MALFGKKLRLIQVAKKRLGLVDDDYRAVLWRVARVRSSKQLDDTSFDRVMAEFQRLGFESDFSKENFGRRHFTMATANQVAFIRDLWSRCTEGQGTDVGLDAWIEKRYPVSSLRFLPAQKANRVISALKGWLKRKQEKSLAAT